MPRVLWVEDDPATTYILIHQLVAKGVCDVTHAAKVVEALAMLDPPPDWVILDMDLPDGSGLLVLEAIRKADMPTRGIASSATEDKSLLATYVDNKPDAILPKPLDPALLPFWWSCVHLARKAEGRQGGHSVRSGHQGSTDAGEFERVR